MKITHASHLTDAALILETSRLAGAEREATVALIVHLAEFDARRLYAGLGFSSTFKYCMEVLRLSEDAAMNRIESARAARRFPVVLDMLVAGTLSPTTARMLARRLTASNHVELLAAASDKSKQDVERLLAGMFPQPDVKPSVRRLAPSPPPVVPPSAAAPFTAAPPPPALAAATPPAVASPVPATLGPTAILAVLTTPLTPSPPHPLVRPLAPERYEIRFTAAAKTYENLRLAQDLLGHAVARGDLAEVFDRALALLVADLQRSKFAAAGRPRKSGGQSEDSRNVPAAVRRTVGVRDGGRCAFVAPDGQRCGERRFVEFHHVQPYGARGKPTVDNIQLRCAAHNRYEAELFYGPGRAYGGVIRSGTDNSAS